MRRTLSFALPGGLLAAGFLFAQSRGVEARAAQPPVDVLIVGGTVSDSCGVSMTRANFR